MRKLTAMIVASTLAIGSTSFAFAAETTPKTDAHTTTHTQGKMKHKGPQHNNSFAGLELTEQQRTQMKDIMKEGGQKHDRAAMKQQMDTMHNLVAADSFDEAAAKTQIESMTQKKNDRLLERMRAENKMYNLLTPEQKKQFSENYQQRAEKMAQPREKKSGKAKTANAE